MKTAYLLLFTIITMNVSCAQDSSETKQAKTENMTTEPMPVQHSDEEWKKKLNVEQYEVLRLKGTERPGTGKYLSLIHISEPTRPY